MRRAVIVTGASRGLGSEVALRFGRAGWAVAVNYLSNSKGAETVAAQISKSGGEAFAFKADVRDYGESLALAEETIARFGRVDVLVNNAGVTGGGLIVKLKEEELSAVMDTNLKGCFNTIKAVSRAMMKQRSGHIINISSIAGVRGRSGHAAYSMSKAGLIGLTKAAAMELAPKGIRVNAALPGYMLTGMGLCASEKAREEALASNLLKIYSDAAEVADFIFHLAGMKTVSGQVFNLDSRVI